MNDRNNKLLKAIGDIDDKYIEEAAPAEGFYNPGNRKQGKMRRSTVKWAAAACFTGLLIAAAALILTRVVKTPDTAICGTEITRNYKNVHIRLAESAVNWPWEYKTADEKYPVLTFDGREYSVRSLPTGGISRELTESEIGKCAAENGGTFTAYSIKGIDQKRMIAADPEGGGGEYYVYASIENIPDSLGAFLNECDIPSLIELKHFTVHYENGTEREMILKDDTEILKMLTECAAAERSGADGGGATSEKSWDAAVRGKHISFTVTSEAMGIYRRVMTISENGYFLTNIYDVALVFDIGRDTAGRIIDHVLTHADRADETEYEQKYGPEYGYNVVGTVVSVEDGYFLVDDAVLCIDPAEHMVFKVITNNLRISRYFDHNIIKEGDTVYVQYSGDINTDSENEIDSAVLIARAIINGDGFAVPE